MCSTTTTAYGMVFQSGWDRCRTAPACTGWLPNRLASSSSSPKPSGNGQPIPAATARSRYSWTVPSPIPQQRAIWRCPNPNSNLNRRTSLTFRMDFLLAGTLSSFIDGVSMPVIVQRRCTSCCSSVENIPLQAERHSARREKLFAFPPESAFTFRPECCSESQRNRVRLHSGIAFTFDRIPHYTHRVAISNHRLLSVDGDRVTFRWKDYAHHSASRAMTLTLEEFLRRFLQHVLPKGLPRIRYVGWLANRRRRELLPLCRRLLAVAPPPAEAKTDAAAVWQCPICGSPMHVVELLTAAQIQQEQGHEVYILDSS